jgi:hypothetical protein
VEVNSSPATATRPPSATGNSQRQRQPALKREKVEQASGDLFYVLVILNYNELDHSLPAWVPAWVPVPTNFKYYYHCGVGKKIGLLI